MSTKIDHLIINGPYSEPTEHWAYLSETQSFERRDGRRPAGYWRSTGNNRKGLDDQGEFVELALVNQIRPRVRAWVKAGYPNITGTTRKLLDHWVTKAERNEQQLFWCQLEAIETAIWLLEAPDNERFGIDIPSDSDWIRICFKLATGAGKTVVMAMIVAWQALNKIASPQDARFSKNILVVAPGITVRDRLRVLEASNPENFYEQFSIVPPAMWQELLQAKILVRNWHALAPIREDSGPKVVKKGAESDEAFVHRVVPEFNGSKNILVINDEAHHCHRPTGEESKEEKEQATIWISGIDRIHGARGIVRVYDLSATPFKPTGKNNRGELLFPWIVSDFGLNDAIESGLVKTPKVAVRDDSVQTRKLQSRFFHIYQHVKEDLNRRADKKEGIPDLLKSAIEILGADWLKAKDNWGKIGIKVPPVLIIISNRAETANRIEYAITQGYTAVKELGQKAGLLVMHQDALDALESEEGETKDERTKIERARFNTVGKEGKPGAPVQCVLGVNMLSEGWDARTVTHILGVRAFSSQLLCEQVIGRGLRRWSYDVNPDTGKLDPEYVTVFGVPFTYLPVESDGATPTTEKPKTEIKPMPERADMEIRWPHVIRVEQKLSYLLDLEWGRIKHLVLSAEDTPTAVEIAPVIDGKPDFSKVAPVDLQKLAENHRLQTMKLQSAVQLHERFAGNWPGDPASHISQLVSVLDKFIESDRLQLKVPLFQRELWERIILALNVQRIGNHIAEFIKHSSVEEPIAVLDPVRPIRSTGSAMAWRTSKPTQPVQKSQMSHIVIDSSWESVGLEFERDRIQGLQSWAKNDHLGFEIYYLWQGMTRTYYPDFLIKFSDNRIMILEVKGQGSDQTKAKHAAAEEWVRAVNALGDFGKWEFKVLWDPKNLFDVVK